LEPSAASKEASGFFSLVPGAGQGWKQPPEDEYKSWKNKRFFQDWV